MGLNQIDVEPNITAQVNIIVRRMGKGNNIRDFLFASLVNDFKMGSLLKGKNLLLEKLILSL